MVRVKNVLSIFAKNGESNLVLVHLKVSLLFVNDGLKILRLILLAFDDQVKYRKYRIT